METTAALIELRPNSLSVVEDWKRFIEVNLDEALATLSSQGVLIESWFSIQLANTDYLLCVMRANSISHAQKTFRDSVSPVDEYHQHFKEMAWVKEGVTKAELLLDLQAES